MSARFYWQKNVILGLNGFGVKFQTGASLIRFISGIAYGFGVIEMLQKAVARCDGLPVFRRSFQKSTNKRPCSCTFAKARLNLEDDRWIFTNFFDPSRFVRDRCGAGRRPGKG